MEIDLREKQGRCRWRKNWRQYSVYKPALIICGDSLNRKSSEYQRLVEIATKKYCCVVVGYQ